MNIAILLNEFYRDYLRAVDGDETIWKPISINHSGFCWLFAEWVEKRFPHLNLSQHFNISRKMRQRQRNLFKLAGLNEIYPFGSYMGIDPLRTHWAKNHLTQYTCENIWGKLRHLGSKLIRKV